MSAYAAARQRIVIVSNRLPFTVREEEGGALLLEGSAGGLVSGLSAWLEALRPAGPSAYTWVGWPGMSVPVEDRPELEALAEEHFNSHPVYLSGEEMERFYQGLCNTTIWPLFHYFPSYAEYHESHWKEYKRVNEAFCEAVVRMYRPGDIIWVHDYHLMLLPGLLRSRLPDAPIGFFLHIPFPSYELLRIIPGAWRDSLLKGMLGADLIGFHAQDYAEHFFRASDRFLGYERSAGSILAGNRSIRVSAFPMGIDYERYARAAESPQARVEKERLRRILGDVKVVLAVDRLDYTKGIINRLQAYATFLEHNPDLHGKLVMVLVVTPSRVGVRHYEETKQQIETLVGNINGRFGHMGWMPVRYQHRFVPLVELAALYSVGDIALITPLRDGMNMISKEYLASRTDSTGVLVLSELTGAAAELREAVLTNPNSPEQIAAALKRALQMPVAEQVRRNRKMQERLKIYDVTPWAQQFVRELVHANRVHSRGPGSVGAATAVQSTEAPEGSRAPGRRRLFIHQDGRLLPVPQNAENGSDDNEDT